MGERKPFEIFRAADARDYGEHGIQAMVEPPPEALAALGQFGERGGGAGQDVSLAYARPGISLTRVWFKSGYPLPLHSHSGDCLYFILAGSIRFGDGSEIGPGDGFFVASDVPYTYEIGPAGVEVLEFRGTDVLDIRFRAKGKAPWDRILARLDERSAGWETEPPPSKAAQLD